MWWSKRSDSMNCDPVLPSKCESKRWIVLPSMPQPGQVAKRVLSKSFPVHLLIQRDQDGSIDVYSSVQLSAAYLRRLLAVLPVQYLNFSDVALVVLQAGYSVLMTVTPQYVREGLLLERFPEFCSTHVGPLLASAQGYISENKSEFVCFAEEVIPTLRLLGGQSVIIIKLVSSKSLPFVSFCYKQLKPKIQSQLREDQLKDLVLSGVHIIRKFLQFCVQSASDSYDSGLLKYVLDHRTEISKAVLGFVKVMIKAFILATPVGLRMSHQLGTMSYNAVEDALRLISTFLEQNPDLRDQLQDAVFKLNSLFRESGYSSVDLIVMFCVAVGNGFGLFFRVLQVLWPVLLAVGETHSTVLLKTLDGITEVLLPLMCLLLRKLFSSETKDLIRDNVPIIISTLLKLLTIMKPFVAYGVSNSKSLLCVVPTAFEGLSQVSFYSVHVASSIAFGLFFALCEISPHVINSLTTNLPIVKTGASVVFSDVWAAAKIVAPTLHSGLRIVSCDLWSAYLEVYPDLLKAAAFVYPELLRASSIVAPALLEASTELCGTVYQASSVVIPTTCRSVLFVAPTLWKATKISSPVLLNASLTVSCTTKLALEELMRTSRSALCEVVSTSAAGMSVVVEDLIRSYHAVSQNSDIAVGKSLRNSVYITSSAFQEVNSLLWILFCLKSVDVETLSQSQFQFEFNLWNRQDLTTSLCRKSCEILNLSMKAALFCKICLKKSNSLAAASICETNIRISRYYEKMEPVVVDLAVKSGTYLKGIFNLDEVPEYMGEVPERRTEMEDRVFCKSKGFGATRGVYHSQNMFGKISLAFPKPTFSLQDFTTELCRAFVSVISKTGSSIWHAGLLFAPPLWRFVETASPEIWHQLCDIAPGLWSALCTLCRETWKGIRIVCPKLWHTYSMICVVSWKVLCKLAPQVWKVVKDVSPSLWSHSCNLSSRAWTALCDNSGSTWDLLCEYGPRAWQHLCHATVLSWDAYRHVVSTSWRVFCFGVGSSWKIQRIAISTWWQSLVVNRSAANALVRESSPFLQALLGFGGQAWFCFCAMAALFVIVYHCDSVVDLLFNSNFNGVDLSASAHAIAESQDPDKVILPKANQALQYVVEDIVTVKSYFDYAKNFIHCYLSGPSLEAAVNLRSELSIKYKAASKKMFSNRFVRSYYSMVYESRSVINSLRLVTGQMSPM